MSRASCWFGESVCAVSKSGAILLVARTMKISALGRGIKFIGCSFKTERRSLRTCLAKEDSDAVCADIQPNSVSRFGIAAELGYLRPIASCQRSIPRACLGLGID